MIHSETVKTNTHHIHSLFFAAFTALAFVISLLIGDASHDIDRLSMLTGGIATSVTLILGLSIIYFSWDDKDYIMMSTILAIWAANIAYSFTNLEVPYVDMLYDFATILIMISLYRTRYTFHKFSILEHFSQLKRKNDFTDCYECVRKQKLKKREINFHKSDDK